MEPSRIMRQRQSTIKKERKLYYDKVVLLLVVEHDDLHVAIARPLLAGVRRVKH